MDVRPRPDARDDAELVRAVTAGDRGAFAAIYDRYADRLHDFCWSVLRDRDEAADATQDAFLVAAERLGQLRDPERLRPWLYAVARSQALRRARARSRLAPEEDMTDLPDPATGPEQAAQRADLRELVWNAAAGLSERDRALLDLHLRHGLEGADLGEAIGVEPAHAYVLLTRLRDQVERSLGALLVARRKLASPLALLAAVPPMPAPADLRGRVLEQFQLASAASGGAGDPGDPGAVQPQAGMAGPPEGESSRRGEVGESDIHSPPPGVGVGWPATDEAGAGKGRRRTAVAALVAAMLLSVGVGVGLGWERSPAESSPSNDQGGGPVVAGAATSTAPTSTPTTAAPSTSTSTSTSVTTSTTTPPPAAPPSLTVSPARVDLGSAGTSATLTVRNGGDEPLSWAAAPSTPWLRVRPSSGRLDGGEQARLSLSATRDGLPEGDANARVELTWGGAARSVAVALRVEHPPEISDLGASPPQIAVAPCVPTTTLVGATVTDESGLSSVTLRWGGQSVPMAQRSGRWFARLGPVASPGTVSWQVVATDSRGNTASASGPPVRVLACR